MGTANSIEATSELASLVGDRVGPYNSHNPVSRTQIWQWCAAMGDRNPLYLDAEYQRRVGIGRAVAPPAMMQMWTMRDVRMAYAPGSTDLPPYRVLDYLSEKGFPGNVAVSYDISFHRYLLEGDRAHHYTTVVDVSALKETALGTGYFVTEKVEYLDQDDGLFAEALITYFQYCPGAAGGAGGIVKPAATGSAGNNGETRDTTAPPFTDRRYRDLTAGDALPDLAIPITHKLIVGGAVASQDFIDVHHNAEAARAAAMPDIFMNILTTCGLSARYLTDWAGPGSRLQKLRFKLLAPNLPGDLMIMQGRIARLQRVADENRVEVEFSGKNSLGAHVAGFARLALAN